MQDGHFDLKFTGADLILHLQDIHARVAEAHIIQGQAAALGRYPCPRHSPVEPGYPDGRVNLLLPGIVVQAHFRVGVHPDAEHRGFAFLNLELLLAPRKLWTV